MNKLLLHVVMFVVLAGVTGGCSPAPIPVAPTHAAFSLPTLIPPTRIPPTPTAIPTATSSPAASPTIVPPTTSPSPAASPTIVSPTAGPSPAVSPTIVSPTASPSPAASPTVVLPTASPLPAASPTPIPSPTPAIAPGVYVTDLRTDPPPVRGPELKFYVTFLNSMGREQNYRWAVYIFRADTQRGIGETTRTDSPIPTSATEQQSYGSWKLPLGGPCDYFYAQVAWINAENKTVWFTTPGGAVFQKVFTVCPP